MLCGRKGLKKVLWIASVTDDGEEVDYSHYGSTCGSKLVGRKVKEVRKLEKSFYTLAWEAKKKIERNHPKYERGRELIEELNNFNGKRLLGKERLEHPLMREYLKIQEEIRKDVENIWQGIEL